MTVKPNSCPGGLGCAHSSQPLPAPQRALTAEMFNVGIFPNCVPWNLTRHESWAHEGSGVTDPWVWSHLRALSGCGRSGFGAAPLPVTTLRGPSPHELFGHVLGSPHLFGV